MTAACLTDPTADTLSDGTERAQDAGRRTSQLAVVLDVQVAEVPGTANAIEYFFGDV